MTLPRHDAARLVRARGVWAALRVAALLPAGAALPLPGWAQTVAEVQITPETMTLGTGQRQPLFAAAYDRQGNLIPTARFAYRSSDTLVARVMRDGTVVGIGPGLARVEARSGNRRASMAVLVTGADTAGAAGPPAGSVLTLDPASVILLPGESVTMAAQAMLEDGSRVPPGRIAWRSLQPGVAAVDSGGVLIGVSPGRAIVQAGTTSGLTATAPVEVAPAEIALSPERLVLGPEETDTLRAVVPAQGNRVVRLGLQWRSTDTTVVRVGPTGIVTALAPGQAEIVISGFGQERRAQVLVHRAPQALVVSPPSSDALRIPVGGSEKLSAVAEAADSTPIPEARLDWEVADTAVAALDTAARTVTGKAVGSTTVTVRLRGFDPVVWTVDVISGLLALEPATVGLGPGGRATLIAHLLDDSRGAIGQATGLQWSSSRPDVARVAGEGTVDALSPGRATVTATAPWGRSATAQVLVTADLLLSSNRSGNFGIYQVRPTPMDTLLPILADSAQNVQAVLSPDRTRIAFSSDRHGSYDLFVMEADGQNLRRLTSDAGSEGEPVWTPDGKRIVYTSAQPGGGSQLYAIGADGEGARAITDAPGGNHSADVSPDGGRIAFVSARDGNQEVYVMDAAGGEARRITRTGSRESSPRFLPGGELVFVAERGRSKSAVLRIAPGDAEAAVLFDTDQPITALDVSRDGERLAYVTGRAGEKGKARLSLFVRPPAADGEPVPIVLRPGEHVLSPSF